MFFSVLNAKEKCHCSLAALFFCLYNKSNRNIYSVVHLHEVTIKFKIVHHVNSMAHRLSTATNFAVAIAAADYC